MSKPLESLLNLLCKSVTLSQQNALQSLYTLADAQDAKLAYDLLIAAGVEAKYFAEPDGSGGKLYIQNGSAEACESKIAASLTQATLFKQIKDLADRQDGLGAYSLAFANTSAGRQLTLLLPPEKQTASAQSPKPAAAPAAATTAKSARAKMAKKEDDSVLGGPAVARAAIPKSMKTSDTEEDPLSKRIFFFLTGRAFTSTAWLAFFALVLAVIFSVIITVRAFLCPDIAGVQDVPAYCPHKVAAPSQQ